VQLLQLVLVNARSLCLYSRGKTWISKQSVCLLRNWHYYSN